MTSALSAFGGLHAPPRNDTTVVGQRGHSILAKEPLFFCYYLPSTYELNIGIHSLLARAYLVPDTGAGTLSL